MVIRQSEDNSFTLDRLDHLIYTVPDLDEAIDEIEALLGVRPVIGGRHPDFGTRNALLGLGGQSYLEIMAPDWEMERPQQGRPFGLDTLEKPRLATWVVREESIEKRMAVAKSYKLDLGEVQHGSREKPDGSIVSWRISDPYAPRLGGMVPFLIAWGDTPHPADSIPCGGKLVDLRLLYPLPLVLREGLSALNFDLPVDQGSPARIIGVIRTTTDDVELG